MLDTAPFPRTQCFRSHKFGTSPLLASPHSNYRFNSPLADRAGGTAFGVLYVALEDHGAYIETVGFLAGGVVSESWCTQREMATLEVGPLSVVDLTGPGLARAGYDASVTSGINSAATEPYATSQALAKQIYDNTAADAILYRARHDPSALSLAIFDRALPKVDHISSVRWTNRPRDLVRWLRRYHHVLGP